MAEPTKRVIIYGGKGALGAKCVSHFKANNCWVGSIDLTSNNEADFNILVTNMEGNLPEQEQKVLDALNSILESAKVDAIICVAGGFAAGNIKKALAKNVEIMWRQNVWTSIISASIAAKYLKEDGLLTLAGANIALRETPGMIGYGLAKAAVHHLTKSLAGNNLKLPVEAGSGLPYKATCVAILPTILDTPTNRLWMPKADFAEWTPMEFVAELFWKWCNNTERPKNGSLVQLVTKHSKTDVVPVESLWGSEMP